jgi:hypothetical protein
MAEDSELVSQADEEFPESVSAITFLSRENP